MDGLNVYHLGIQTIYNLEFSNHLSQRDDWHKFGPGISKAQYIRPGQAIACFEVHIMYIQTSHSLVLSDTHKVRRIPCEFKLNLAGAPSNRQKGTNPYIL